MKKILIVANIISFIEKFNTEIINLLKDELNYEVHVACNTEYMDDTDTFLMLSFITGLESKGVVLHHVPILRSPFQMQNISAYRRLKEIIDAEHFDIIHCHTPVGAMLARLAARGARKQGTKVIYTAHGFHFYKGAPLKNWLLYYPAECLLARWTDVLITINKEDYQRAQTFKAGKVVYVPGVGIDTTRFGKTITAEERHNIRAEIGVPDDALLLCSVGELIQRKNHALVIRALAGVDNKNVHYCIAGAGAHFERLTELSKELGLSDRTHFLGYCSNICNLHKASDIFCFPSIHEGLPVALMEAMASGLPCLASRIRGNVDLMGESSEMLFDPHDVGEFKRKLEQVIAGIDYPPQIDYSNMLLPFSQDAVLAQMKEVYINTSMISQQDMKEVSEMNRL